MNEVELNHEKPAGQEILKDGIENCEDLCPCGAHLRLHKYTFGKKENKPKQRFYIDCTAQCGRVSDWHDTPDDAIQAFDHEFQAEVSNASQL